MINTLYLAAPKVVKQASAPATDSDDSTTTRALRDDLEALECKPPSRHAIEEAHVYRKARHSELAEAYLRLYNLIVRFPRSTAHPPPHLTCPNHRRS